MSNGPMTQEDLEKHKLRQFQEDLDTNKKLYRKAKQMRKAVQEEQARKQPIGIAQVFPGLIFKGSKK